MVVPGQYPTLAAQNTSSMLQLSKSPKNKKWYVATMASNHLELSATQPKGLASRKGAIKNIRSQLKSFNTTSVLVQDNTGHKSVVYNITADKIEKTEVAAVKPYVPGPPPAKKKVKKVVRKAAKKKK